MKITQCLRRNAIISADQVALQCGAQQQTWSQLRENSANLAALLKASGVQRGQGVAMLADSCLEYFEFHFGVPWAGGMIVPLNTRLSDPELIEILQDSESVCLIAAPPYLERARQLASNAPSVLHLFEIDSGNPDADYRRLVDDQSPIEDLDQDASEIAALVYTGGTTGRAKGVALSHGNIVANALVAMNTMEFRQDMIYLHATPLFHTAGSGRVYSTAIAGGRGVILPKFDEIAVLREISNRHITHLLLVPTMLNRLLNHPEFDRTDFSSLTNISYGASIMPEALLKLALAKLPNVRFTQSYGMTELSPSAAYLPPEYHTLDGPTAGKLTSIGIPVHTAEIRIADNEDKELKRGEVGEIQVRGPMVMQGYWKQKTLSDETLKGGWMHTGDAAYMDDDGFIFLVDRFKDMIISGGENVYSGEVENALYEHDAVKECAVIGIPDPQWGERVHAIVVLHPGMHASEVDLLAHCRSLIAGYKTPRAISFREQPLPLSATNKILKSELRKAFLENTSLE
ncbi:MAG: class I adenylate-forming enzyme family protein [Gammaproteobacteria bacterium]